MGNKQSADKVLKEAVSVKQNAEKDLALCRKLVLKCLKHILHSKTKFGIWNCYAAMHLIEKYLEIKVQITAQLTKIVEAELTIETNLHSVVHKPQRICKMKKSKLHTESYVSYLFIDKNGDIETTILEDETNDDEIELRTIKISEVPVSPISGGAPASRSGGAPAPRSEDAPASRSGGAPAPRSGDEVVPSIDITDSLCEVEMDDDIAKDTNDLLLDIMIVLEELNIAAKEANIPPNEMMNFKYYAKVLVDYNNIVINRFLQGCSIKDMIKWCARKITAEFIKIDRKYMK